MAQITETENKFLNELIKDCITTDCQRRLLLVVPYYRDHYGSLADNIQYRINVLVEIDDSIESKYDKHEPCIPII